MLDNFYGKMIDDLGWLLILHMMVGLLARRSVSAFVGTIKQSCLRKVLWSGDRINVA